MKSPPHVRSCHLSLTGSLFVSFKYKFVYMQFVSVYLDSVLGSRVLEYIRLVRSVVVCFFLLFKAISRPQAFSRWNVFNL